MSSIHFLSWFLWIQHVLNPKWLLLFEGEKFDRIIYTFPRIYHQSWQKWEYNHHNTTLINGILKSCLNHLEVDGEIHHLMFRGQFYHWWIKKSLEEIGMVLAYWCKLDVGLLNQYFPGYAPRDIWGNSVNLNDWTVYLCAFRRRKAAIRLWRERERLKLNLYHRDTVEQRDCWL